METPVLPKHSYRFGLFRLDLQGGGRLERRGLPVKLRGQPLQVLCLLLERAGEVVPREELRRSLWPEGTYVEFDASLNAALKRLRFALGDNTENPVFIETVPKEGYRFIAPVERDQPANEHAPWVTAVPAVPAPQTSPRDSVSIARRQLKSRSAYWWLLVPAALLLVCVWSYTWVRSTAPIGHEVIAVLPFVNEGAGRELDYLRYAIANDLVTDLSHVRSVTVRPFASTSRYVLQPTDPVAAGKELRVSHVLTGGYLLEGPNLLVSLELVDVRRNEPVWRDEIAVPGRDLLGLRTELADRITRGLPASLKLLDNASVGIPKPSNARAFDLYLHSISIPDDPIPNLIAIRNLEESVSVDADYAPAWEDLSHRYYIDYEYGDGGRVSKNKSLDAIKRAREIDPNGTATAAPILAEEGELIAAYDDARSLLRKRPDSSLSHYTMSYVLRYAGLLGEAANECDAALKIDPGFSRFRSCATTFTLLRKYERARAYVQLDENSGFGAALRMEIALRAGNSEDALAEANTAARTDGTRYVDVIRACMGPSPKEELPKAEAENEADPKLAQDSEGHFRYASVLGYCGESDEAIKQLRKAIQGNYCSFPAVASDPLFQGVRRRPDFAELSEAGMRCQQNFLAARQQLDNTP